jgi:hypothetical protein
VQRYLYLRTRLTLILALALFLLSYASQPVLAAHTVSGCLPNIGKKIPVLFVHGILGYGDDWLVGNPSLQQVISGISGVYADSKLDTFDYHLYHAEWVDNPHIGPALAMKIACMAQSSREQGGPGKDIIVAYSMGGLASRFAANVVLPGGHKITDDIGLVITIATPNNGAVLADLVSSFFRAVCTFGTINFAGQQIHSDSVRCDQLLPAMWAMETNLTTHVGSLPKFPKSLPVMAIAGNVFTTIPLLFPALPVSRTDLVVGVDSALADANVLPQGGGTYVTPLCSTIFPISTLSGANCEHTQLLTNKYVQITVAQSIQHYLDYLYPPCPTIAGACVGIHSGDMDADGIPDRVGITYGPNNCQAGVASSCRIGIRVVLDNGGVVDGLVPWTPPGVPASLDYLGLSDIRGDGRSVVFLYATGSCSECGTLFTYELKQGALQPLSFSNGSLSIDSGINGNGFTCRVVKGVHQVLSVTIPNYAGGTSPGSYTATENVYQPDSNGRMVLSNQRAVTYTQQQANAAVGAHCKGLNTF